MSLLKPFLVTSALLALTGCATMPPPAATQAAFEPDIPLMKSVVQRLSADDFEGRGPSTAVEPKILDYIVGQFKAAGLQPGNHGQWLQEVPTVEITAGNATPLTVSGNGKTESFGFGDQYVAASYRVTPQTRVENSPLVFVGYGIVAPELGWNDYAGVDMHGKTAVILVNDPDYASATEDGLFKGRRMTYYGRWTYKYEEAARQGAAAALIVHDSFPAAYGWNVVNSSWTGAQYYVQSANDGMDQTQANGWVQKPVAEAVLRAAGKDLAALTTAAQTKGFRAVPLGLTATFGFNNAVRKSTSHNVIGLLPGTTRADEYVMYGAHWDHLGRCTPDKTGDDICNGAVDNATGVAALVALAEANRKAGPTPRSQVFAAWTLEESGLLGSKWYAEHPAFPLSQTVGGVNIDALDPGGRVKDYANRGGDKSDLTGIFEGALAKLGLVESPEPQPEQGKYYRSDHFSLAKLGVPMYHLVRGNDMVVGGPAAGAAAKKDYNDNRYHQPSDEFSDSWNWDGIAEDVTLFYTLGRKLAEGTMWPNWHQGDEFRAIRDKDCAASPKGC